MATSIRLRGGTTSQHSSFTGAAKEITVDTTKNTIVVHDGSTAGGIPLAKASEVFGGTYTGDVDITGELIVDSYNETYAAVNCEAGNAFSHVLTENTTFTFSNPPASGTAFSFSIEIIQDASASGFSVTWPTSVDWPSATAPTLTATANAKDIFVFYTRDGGTNFYGFTAGQALG